MPRDRATFQLAVAYTLTVTMGIGFATSSRYYCATLLTGINLAFKNSPSIPFGLERKFPLINNNNEIP